MPRIATATLQSHRAWRRNSLIETATSLILDSDGDEISIAQVAKATGISRTSVYEYFGNQGELIADVVLQELSQFANHLQQEIAQFRHEPYLAITRWIEISLAYVADGRHLIARALHSADIDVEKSRLIRAKHKELLQPIEAVISDLGIADIHQALAFIQAASDTAAKRIENGSDAEREIVKTVAFCIAGVQALI